MTVEQQFKTFLEEQITASRDRFMESISTDENSDYRRGFLAGELFARLNLKSTFTDLVDPPLNQ